MRTALLLFATLLLTAHARTINVVGEGTSNLPPDQVTLEAGVTTTAKSAVAALTDNNRKFARLVAVVKEKGIADKDVQTSSFDVFQDFRGRGDSRMRVYTVSNQVTIKVRDVAMVGEILDALVRAGSNEIYGITFGLQDSQMGKDTARKLAVADAARKAELFAKSAGVKVGKVLAISETAIAGGSDNGATLPNGEFAARETLSVSPGELDVEVIVYVLYELVE